jgi:GNAT superfamily N-acetyltransferase
VNYRTDLKFLVEIYTDAYITNPINNFLFGETKNLKEALAWVCEKRLLLMRTHPDIRLKVAYRHACGTVVGAIGVIPDGCKPSLYDTISVGILEWPFRYGFKSFLRAISLDGDDKKVESPSGERAGRIVLMAVDPAFHGRGIGTLLITAILREWDASGGGSLDLHTQLEINTKFYSKKGFEVSHLHSKNGYSEWTMIRQPANKHSPLLETGKDDQILLREVNYRTDLKFLAEIFTDAYMTNPTYNFLFGETKNLKEALAWVCEKRLLLMRTHPGIRLKVAYRHACGTVVGAIGVIPDECKPSLYDTISGGILEWPFRFGFKSFFRAISLDSGFKKVESAPGERTGRIVLMAVDPAFHGKGIGTLLLTAALREWDASGGGSIDLHTQLEINTKFYSKKGFEVSHFHSKNGYSEWTMIRQPANNRSSLLEAELIDDSMPYE